MSYEAQSHDMHQLELVMTTIFACRSVVKYGLTLGEEQKKELLADIDMSLEVLRSYLLTSSPMHPKAVSSQSHPANFLPMLSQFQDESASSDTVSDNDEQHILRELYKIYYNYIGANKEKSWKLLFFALMML